MEMRFDRVEIGAARKTPEGYITDDPILTRTGVFEYRNKDGSVRREYRPPEVVFAPETLAAYAGLPITNGHPGEVNAKNIQKHLVGTVMAAGRQDGENVRAPVLVFDTAPIENEGKKELSVGYGVAFDETPGKTPEGVPYDVKQTANVPNHLALCRKGRAGTARLNLDAADDADQPEEETTMTMVKVAVAGLSYDAAPEVANHLKTIESRADSLEAERDAAVADKAKLQAEFDALKANESKIRQDAIETATARVKLETTLKAAKVDFKQDAEDKDLQIAFIKHVRGDSFDATGKSDAYVQAAFDLASEAVGKEVTKVGDQRRAMHQDAADTDKAKGSSAAAARQRMIAASRGEQAAK